MEMFTDSELVSNAQPDLLTEKQAAERLRVCTKTLYNMRRRGEIPFVRLKGRVIRYRIQDLDAFIASRTVMGGDQ